MIFSIGIVLIAFFALIYIGAELVAAAIIAVMRSGHP